ncbi:hypothetical protein RHGRI_031476 [Rhododendron griersonianum]|uniref:ABC transporter domain-containing protein n=1 Tax=Rhododendron griersonianum TaxID=479676 RepID=A0AAV6IDV6_9ERIC|nr:hypothetical protein RHGRI_031476 [Rhododendron griersonianum]
MSHGAKLDKPFPPGYACSDVELVNNFTECSIPRPHEFPPLLEIPDSEDRAVRTAFLPFGDLPDGSCKKTNSCPVTVLVTGSNKSLGSSTAEPANYKPKMYLDPAFLLKGTIYNIQRRCRRNSLSSISMGSEGNKIAIKCIKGLCLWRNSSSEINDELFKGDQDGNSERIANEIIAAYDLLNSSDKKFNASVWYKSSLNEGDPGPNSMMRVACSVNLVSNAYLEFLLGTNFKILFEFVKEMPKHPDSPLADNLISMFSTVFFTWIVLQLIPVILTNLVYDKQENIQIMTKMHGLGDGPYWMISYIYFLAISLHYMLCFSASCSFLGLGSFTTHDYSLQFVFFYVYINLQIAFSFLVARMFSKVKTTSVVAYFIVFATGLVGMCYFQGKVDDPSFPRNLVTVLELYPGFALYRIFHEFSVKAQDFERDFSSAEKADIAQEREKVEELLVWPDRSYSIVCDNLRKVYPGMDGNPRKVAVHGLSLALARGECFGMLGPNGAGKSTFIKMAVEESLSSVNLLNGGVADKQAGKYSGGMKRRLSVAILLIGDPKVVYMDEPSTGLDPASRNELWKVVMRAKRNKVIILTTHSMEEAEHLCERLGIFVDGRLQCIGNAKQAWGSADTTLEDVFIKVARGAAAFNVI